MRIYGAGVLFGFLIWLVVLALAILITPFREAERPLFESIMAVALSLCTTAAACIYLGRVQRRFLRQGVLLGILWLAVTLALDALVFSRGPMQMSPAAYLKDIGLTYLIIPTITIGLGFALERQSRVPEHAH